jgi:hypothetical protein
VSSILIRVRVRVKGIEGKVPYSKVFYCYIRAPKYSGQSLPKNTLYYSTIAVNSYCAIYFLGSEALYNCALITKKRAPCWIFILYDINANQTRLLYACFLLCYYLGVKIDQLSVMVGPSFSPLLKDSMKRHS